MRQKRLLSPTAAPYALTRDAAARLTPTTVPLEEAVGRVTAREVISPEASPNADLAAMDASPYAPPICAVLPPDPLAGLT